MNIIQRELNIAIDDYQCARRCLAASNGTQHMKADSMAYLNRARARLMNLVKATNVILGRV
jgi:hypothetical protein